MKKRAVVLLLAFSIILCLFSCDDVAPISTPSPSQHEPSINTPSRVETNLNQIYKGRGIGSSKQLQGRCILINVFLSTKGIFYNDIQKQCVMNILKSVDSLLNREIAQYNKNLTLLYNLEDLSIDYTINFLPSNNDYGTDWDFDLISEIYALYDIDALLEKYNADNVSFLLNINQLSGRSYAYRMSSINHEYYAEHAVIFFPAGHLHKDTAIYTYLHEILHLFGAIDLYYDKEASFSKDVQKEKQKLEALAKEYFPNEVMLVESNLELPFISNLTAYMVGWTDSLEQKYAVFLEEYKIE